MQDKSGGCHYKKNFEQFIKVIKERYQVPLHLIDRINKKLAEIGQIATIFEKKPCDMGNTKQMQL